MVKHVIGRLLAAAALAATLLAGPAAATATAAPATTGTTVAAAAVTVPKGPSDLCNSSQLSDADKRSMGCYDDRISANNDYLPAQRWADAATGLHLRTGDGVLDDLSTRLQRQATFPLWMGLGNGAWSWATDLTSWAVSLDIMKSVGLQVDTIAAKLGKAITDSAILGAIIGIAIIFVLWRAARGRSNPWGYIVRATIVLALLVVMSIGAAASTVSGGQYRPGVMSPGWLATKTNSIVSSLASAPALALSNEMTAYIPDTATGERGILSCDAYTAELARQYAASAGGGNALTNKLEASVPMLLSRMWEQTGLEVWKTAQFGSNNPYGDYMYCRLLEERAGQAEVVQMMLTSRAASGANTPIPSAASPNLQAAPWGTGGDVEPRDRSLIAWGACRLASDGTWRVTGDWGEVTRSGGRGAITPDDCAKWWSEDFYTDAGPSGWLAGDSNNLEFSGKSADTRNDTRNAPEARDFLLSLHGGGANAGGNTVMVFAYFVSAIAILLVFLVLAGAVLVAKVASVVMALAIFLLLLKDLLPGQEGNSSAAKVAKAYVGVAFATFALSLLLAMVAVITGFLVEAATDWFGGSSVMAIVWTGAAPLVALLSIHLLFTKILKMPSPLTVKGAKAWGDRVNSGAVGGSLTETMASRASAAGRAATGLASRGARAAGGSVLRRTTGGRLGGGAPVKRSGSGVGQAAAATALGAAGGAAAASAIASRSGRLTPAEGGRTGRKTGTDTAGEGGAPSSRRQARAGESRSRVEGAKPGTDTENLSPEELKAPGDSKPLTRAERRAERAAEREQELADNAERRGYGATASTKVVGDVREAFSARLADVRQQFAEKPILSTGKTVLLAGGAATATVLTGGAAAPLLAMAGVSGLSQVHKARAARRRAVEDHKERREIEAAAKEAAERRAAERKEAEAAKATPGSTQRPDVLRSGTLTAVERRAAQGRRPSARPAAVGSSGASKPKVRATPKVAGTRTATPRPAAPALSRRPVQPQAPALPPRGE